MLLHEHLAAAAEQRGGHTALICAGVSYTYAAIHDSAERLAETLTLLGVERGTRVAVYLSNSPEAVVALYATWIAGGCVVPIGLATPVERCCAQIRHCGASVLIAPGNRASAITSALAGSGHAVERLWVGAPPTAVHGLTWDMQTGCDPWMVDHLRHRTGGPIARPLITAPDLAAIIYTSGSSGTPKGVTHTHASFTAAIESIVEYLRNGPDDVILSVLQLNFSYGMLQLLATVRTQATLVLENGFGYPYEVVKQFRRYGVTGFAGAPMIWAMLLQLKDITAEEFSTVRYITNAAAAMPAPFVPRLAALFTNARIYLMHGMTECFRTAYLPPEEVLTNPTSIGRPMRDVELWLEDESGEAVAAGGVGELVIAGPTLMRGYWNDPEGTAKMLRPRRNATGSALHSGDMFRTDERGYLYFVARKDDIIKSRGEKVSPVEVEAVIYQLPEVRECRVIGVPDSVLGYRLRAEIIVREGTTLEEKQVKAQCIRHLEPFKVPQDVAFVTALPKTAGGKIVRSFNPGVV